MTLEPDKIWMRVYICVCSAVRVCVHLHVWSDTSNIMSNEDVNKDDNYSWQKTESY